MVGLLLLGTADGDLFPIVRLLANHLKSYGGRHNGVELFAMDHVADSLLR